jgi:(p)ppGpp synthase/HD superfamily hydrolase
MGRVMSDLEARAMQFATLAHGEINQKRRYTDESYIVHPAAVVQLVSTVAHTHEMLAAAWLHDVVEDTKTTLDEIHRVFGFGVATLVEMVTDVSKPSDGNRKERKRLDRMHLAIASAEAKTIKLADLIDNSFSIMKYDPDFAKVYIPEKRLLLEILREGNPILWQMAHNLINPQDV